MPSVIINPNKHRLDGASSGPTAVECRVLGLTVFDDHPFW